MQILLGLFANSQRYLSNLVAMYDFKYELDSKVKNCF